MHLERDRPLSRFGNFPMKKLMAQRIIHDFLKNYQLDVLTLMELAGQK